VGVATIGRPGHDLAGVLAADLSPGCSAALTQRGSIDSSQMSSDAQTTMPPSPSWRKAGRQRFGASPIAINREARSTGRLDGWSHGVGPRSLLRRGSMRSPSALSGGTRRRPRNRHNELLPETIIASEQVSGKVGQAHWVNGKVLSDGWLDLRDPNGRTEISETRCRG
jgi:hypothetical protein